MMNPSSRVCNFGAGPAALPLPVLERVREELLDFEGTGMSILEVSHRGPAYGRVHNDAIAALRRLIQSSDDYEVVFMGGGARTQFSLVPMNLLGAGSQALYLTTGRWSEMALEAAALVGSVSEIWSSADTGHDRVPDGSERVAIAKAVDAVEPAYLHYTSNNTINGTQYLEPLQEPFHLQTPIIADMSSDILSGPLDISGYGVIYAGAQKNLGCAGVTLVLIRRDLLDRSPESLPPTLSYARMAAKNSLLNTPPVFAIYVLGLVLEHLEATGGLEAMARRNQRKADKLYAAIDSSAGFYRGHARGSSRSRMNVTFRLASPELESRFLAEAEAEGLVGLKGHRSVGGVRASLYNAIEPEAVDALTNFMREFAGTG